MKSVGKYNVYLRGSRKSIQRVVYEEDGKSFIIWFLQLIEVKKGASDYYTVEAY